jgi:cold shock protein
LHRARKTGLAPRPARNGGLRRTPVLLAKRCSRAALRFQKDPAISFSAPGCDDRAFINLKTVEATMAAGVVKWFNDAKGYGFIIPADGSEDLFAHFSEIQSTEFRSLQENQKVTFDVKMGPKGKQAANIQPA